MSKHPHAENMLADRNEIVHRNRELSDALKANTKLRAETERLFSEIQQLRAFAQDVTAGWPADGIGLDELKEVAVEYGLMRPETMEKPCGGEHECHCYELVGPHEFPLTCYRATELLTGRGDG